MTVLLKKSLIRQPAASMAVTAVAGAVEVTGTIELTWPIAAVDTWGN